MMANAAKDITSDVDVAKAKSEPNNENEKSESEKLPSASKEKPAANSLGFDPLVFVFILFLVIGIICAIGLYKIRDKSNIDSKTVENLQPHVLKHGEEINIDLHSNKINENQVPTVETTSQSFTTEKSAEARKYRRQEAKFRKIEEEEEIKTDAVIIEKETVRTTVSSDADADVSATEQVHFKESSENRQKKQTEEAQTSDIAKDIVTSEKPEPAANKSDITTTESKPAVQKDEELAGKKMEEVHMEIDISTEVSRVDALINEKGIKDAMKELMDRPYEGTDIDKLRLLFDRALVLQQFADMDESNENNEKVIGAYEKLLQLPKIPNKISTYAYRSIAERFATVGNYSQAIEFAKKVTQLTPDDMNAQNELGMYYLYNGDAEKAKQVFKQTIEKDPSNGLAAVNYGLLALHHDRDPKTAAEFIIKGIESESIGALDPRYFIFLYEALIRLDRLDEAWKYNMVGYQNGLLLKPDQLSISNINHLKAEPVWKPETTSYEEHFKDILNNITDDIFKEITESQYITEELFNVKNGQIEHLPLFVDGREFQCTDTPLLCGVLKGIPPFVNCRVCDSSIIKFGPKSSYWKHFGPSNFRLRTIFPLGSMSSVTINIGNKTYDLINGSYLTIDDSFIHDISNKNDAPSYVLIVDMWHPELTEHDKQDIGNL